MRFSDRDVDDARLLQRDLGDLFSAPQRASDAQRLDEVRHLCEMARLTIEDPKCHALLRKIEHYARLFFVTDDNVSWSWHTPARYAKLRALLLQLVSAFGLRLTYLKTEKDAANSRLIELLRPNRIRRPRPSGELTPRPPSPQKQPALRNR